MKAEYVLAQIDTDKDNYHVRPEYSEMLDVYYNEDSSCGGQFVETYIPYHLIRNAANETANPDRFFELIDNEAQINITDITEDDEIVEDMIKFFNTEKPDYTCHKAKRDRALMDWMVAQTK